MITVGCPEHGSVRPIRVRGGSRRVTRGEVATTVLWPDIGETVPLKTDAEAIAVERQMLASADNDYIQKNKKAPAAMRVLFVLQPFSTRDYNSLNEAFAGIRSNIEEINSLAC